MSKPGVLLLAARFVPCVAQVRRGTWIALGLGSLLLLGLALWAVVALTGWFLGQAPGWLGKAREVAAEPAQAALEQVEQAVPGAAEQLRDRLAYLMPAPQAERSRRDVSGKDLAPVPRPVGLTRTYWHREGREVTMEYEGRAEYESVLAHYRSGFLALGYAETPRTASPDGEIHDYAKGDERYLLAVSRDPPHGTRVRIETTLP